MAYSDPLFWPGGLVKRHGSCTGILPEALKAHNLLFLVSEAKVIDLAYQPSWTYSKGDFTKRIKTTMRSHLGDSM